MLSILVTDRIPSCCWNGGLLFEAVVGIWSLTAEVEGPVSHCFGAVGASAPVWKTSLLSVLSSGASLLAVPKKMMQALASLYYAGRFLSSTATGGFTSLWDGDRQAFFSSQEEGKNSF